MTEQTREAQARFEAARAEVIAKREERQGIGTLSEKTTHAMLKVFLEPDETRREVPFAGYVADILNPDGVIEIQSAGFHALRKKLQAFLPKVPVTIVYPAVGTKYLTWIDPETGELSEPRKSPKKNGRLDVLKEIYWIRDLLSDPNLTVRMFVLELDEYKQQDGYGAEHKLRASRYDRVPRRIEEEWLLQGPASYAALLPEILPEVFTAQDWRRVSRFSGKVASTTLRTLCDLKIVEKTGQDGRKYLYRICRNGG